jgi:hypothetical protein
LLCALKKGARSWPRAPVPHLVYIPASAEPFFFFLSAPAPPVPLVSVDEPELVSTPEELDPLPVPDERS